MKLNPHPRLYLLAVAATLTIPPTHAQKPEFEVASIRQSQPNAPMYTNFPLGPTPAFTPGGLFIARNMPLSKYVEFALNPANNYQLRLLRDQMPTWARDTGYDIEARADPAATKDDMRLMMRTLLETRFHMAVHHETRQLPVFALTLIKPGKLGPQLRPHPAGDPTCALAPLPQNLPDGIPSQCGLDTMIAPMIPSHIAIGGHNVAIPHIASWMTNARNNIDRPVLDLTGLTGTFDYSIEWTPTSDRTTTPDSAEPELTFIEALRDQLGVKLTPQKGPVDVIILDHIDRPTQN
jgi:uncharacterized protein (TIGR03435 family)